jgi:hypothetical protein
MEGIMEANNDAALTRSDLMQLIDTYERIAQLCDLCPVSAVDAVALRRHFWAVLKKDMGKKMEPSWLTNEQIKRMHEVYTMMRDLHTCPVSLVSVSRMIKHWERQL